MANLSFMTTRQRQLTGRFFASLCTLALFVSVSPQLASAATLTTPRIFLNRQQTNLSSGVQLEVFFTATTNVSGGSGNNKVIIVFPSDASNNTKWCRTTGSLTPTGIANPTGATESATVLPGSLAGTCTQTADTFNVTGVNNLTGGTKYGVRIVANSAAIGSANTTGSIAVTVKTNDGGSDIDTATSAASLITTDQISVTASVDPSLTVSLTATSVNLGTLTTANNSFAGIRSTVTTNAGSGFVSLVKYGATLTSGSDTIADVTGSPPDNMAAGTAAYGVNTTKGSQTITQNDADTSGCTTNGSAATTASAVSASALTTAYQQYSSGASAVSGDNTTLCFLATISATTPAGTYTSTSTLVTTARF